jgi:4-carboxymuconolactone decarboxylase
MGGRGGIDADRLDVRPRIAPVDAEFERALALLDAVVRCDGELTARDKSVLLVAAAAVRDRDATASEVAAARALGVPDDDLRAVALALYLSRGAGPCRAVLDAVDDAAGPPAPHDGADLADVSVREIVEEFRAVFGEVPDRVELLREHSVAGLEAYHRMRRSVLREGRLEPAVAELALVAVNAAEQRGDFAEVHARGARLAGATEAQLVEAGLCAIPSGGVAAWLAASSAIVASRPSPP